MTHNKSLAMVFSVVLFAGALAQPLGAQEQEDTTSTVDTRKPQATRQELTAALASLEQVISSEAYSKSLRQEKEAEAALLRQRLEQGDFQIGDQIDVMVVGEPTLTGKFSVLPDLTLNFPQLKPISIKGVLRSEISAYLTKEIGRYIKNPQVTVQGSYIRLAILGSVGKPGFYTLPADQLISDAIMAAGGPAGDIRLDKSKVRRNGEDVIEGEELEKAVQQGQSLDQLNLHGGDELIIDAKGRSTGRGNWRNYFWPIQAAVSFTYLMIRIF